MSTPTILYVSGLGDGYDGFRKACLNWWRLFGVKTKLVEMKWNDGADFEAKFALVKKAIEAHNNTILVGESAGGSMVLHAAANGFDNVRFATLCGVSRQFMPIADSIQKRSPGFYQATRTIPDRTFAEITAFQAIYDPVVAKKYSYARGSLVVKVASVGHLVTIVLCLTVYAPWFVWRLRRIANKRV